MKFRAHDTFFIRKGWLNKGLSQVDSNGNVFISKEENPMDIFGIGSNMVKSLRYWLQATGLTQEPSKGKRTQTITEFGRCVFENDPYIEEIGTLLLIHYMLATNEDDATAWYFFFNKFAMSEFDKDDFVREVTSYIQMTYSEESIAPRSLEDDFSCIINTYVPRYKSNPSKVNAENNIDCPLGEIGLVDILDKKNKRYKKTIPSKDILHPWIIMAVISDQMKEGTTEIPLNELLTSPNQIGKVFNLDTITMLDVLYATEKLGFIHINRTAGLDVITVHDVPSFPECVRRYYKAITD